MPKFTKAEIEEAKDTLRDMLPPGSKIYTKFKHCSKSGMYRAFDLYVMRNNEPRCINWLAAKAAGLRYDEKHQAIGMSGCGMDMAFAAVYDIARSLYPKGHACSGDSCRSNDHSNDYKLARTPDVHHNDGGYAIQQISF